MPLSRVRMRERKRRDRLSQTYVKPRIVQPVKPTNAELQDMIHQIEKKRIEAVSPQNFPWYDPEKHTTGDKVKQFRDGHIEVVTL